MTYHRMTIDLIATSILPKKEIYTIFGKSLRLPIENQIPEIIGKSQGFVFRELKVQKVTVSKESGILALVHNLIVSEEIDKNESVLLLGFVFFHSFDKIGTLLRQELR